MTWIIRLPGGAGTVESDDFTLDDLEYCETAGGVPWSRMNPWLSGVKVARAFIRTAYRHSGMTPQEADDATQRIALRYVKSMFDHRPDKPFGEDDEAAEPSEDEEPVPLDRSSPPTSIGAPPAGDGPRTKRARSA